MKSVIIGVIAAIAVYFISDAKDKKNRVKKYTMACTIHAAPDTTMKAPFSLSRITEALKERLNAARYKHEIKNESKNNIVVSLSGMTDTISPFSMLISNGRVQFREMYRLDDDKIRLMMMAVVAEINKMKVAAVKKTVAPPVRKDSMSKDVSALLDSMEMKTSTEKYTEINTELIDFSQVYSSNYGSMSSTAEIGKLKLKDTAAVRSLFNLHEIKTKGPSDLQLCFGNIEKPKTKKKEEPTVYLYFIKTYGTERAVLENEDISNAYADIDYNGNARVTLQFNRPGINKWANLTARNINRPIAIIVNGRVISAPNVLSAIPNGAASISGNFTVDETKLLSINLKSNKLPAILRILESTVKEDYTDYNSSRKLLVAFISFAVVASIAFFIFKTLKST